uniref:DBD protein n=1 Tax=Paeonia suffruticosa TaxID=45171 RepID=A0AB38Z7H9_PAESU
MAKGKLIVICQSGGKFTMTSDGSLSFMGGDAHAISVNNETQFGELKSEMAEMWKCDPDLMTLKYFLPSNKRTLITISNDRDIQNMIDFHEGSATVDVYVMTAEDPASAVSTMPCSRSSRTTSTEPVITFNNGALILTDAGHSEQPEAASAEPLTPLSSMAFSVADAGGKAKPWTTVAESLTPLNSLPLSVANGGDSEQPRMTKLWENCITGLQQQFNSVHDFRDALRKYSMALGFTYNYKNNDCKRVTAMCKAEGCPWRIHASRLSTTQLFRIKKFNSSHTCGAGTGTSNRPHASKKLVASIIKEKLRDTPNCKPREIANEIRRDFGIDLRYSQAWRGMETAKEELQGSYKDAYNQLPWLCEKIVEKNPGSVATLVIREDLSFHRLFVAFHASLYGFQNGCRPLLFLDTLSLNSKYPSELLTATSLDGNDGIFPVAFAIVDTVDDDSWRWFLSQLKSVLSTIQPITFVADRWVALRFSISSIFENSNHGYCLHHLTEDLKKDLKNSYTRETLEVIITHVYTAAHATTVDGFQNCVESIQSFSSEAREWILQSEPEHWANAYFQGLRYNHMRSDVALSFYSWVTELPTLTIVQMIDTMRCKMMELIYTRRVDLDQWTQTRLTPCLEEKLRNEIVKASSVQVLLLPDGGNYEVCNGVGGTSVVNIDLWECSCRGWQVSGLPCFHAVAVLQRIDRNIYDYCSKYFSTVAYRLMYSESINPIPTVDKPVQTQSTAAQVLPPPPRRIPGPPKKRRIRLKGGVKRPLHCSKCKGAGHNRATCDIVTTLAPNIDQFGGS